MRWAAITRPSPPSGAARWLRRNTARKCCWSASRRSIANVLKEKGLSDVKGITIMPANDLVDMHDDPGNGTPPQAGFVHGGSVQAAQGRRGRRARFRGQHRRTAHRRDAVRRPHQGHPTRCARAGHAAARTVRSCCAMRARTPNAPPKCCSSSRSSLRCMRRR